MNIKMEKYNLKLRLVDITDAEFIFKLRTNKKLGLFLSKTSLKLADQIIWIKEYKKRELKGLEYYFIVLDKNNERLGTTRIYNIEEDCFEIGSWLFSKDAPPNAAIFSDILTREFGFNKFKFGFCKFEVRKENYKVLKYHHYYNPEIVSEDDKNFYFKLSKEKFTIHSYKLINLLF